MKASWISILKYVIFIAFIIFSSCVSNNNLVSSDKQLEQRRFFEESGLFSIIPPEPWSVTELPDLTYKALIIGEKDEEFFRNITFGSVMYCGKIDEYIDLFLERFNTLFNDDFKLIERTIFTTKNNLEGEKILVNLSLNGQYVRQIYYFFRENNDRIFQAVASTAAEAGDIFDEIFDMAMKSLRWENFSENTFSKGGRRFVEETGCFSFLLDPALKINELQGTKYKTIVIGKTESVESAVIDFAIRSFDYDLGIFADLFLEQF